MDEADAVIVILNSDVMWGSWVEYGVPAAVQQLLQVCCELGHEIRIPQTSYWEIERSQGKIVTEARNSVEAATALLAKWGATIEPFGVNQMIPTPDLLGLMRQYCDRVALEEPSLEDLRDAHRRASLHLPPQPGDAKSDEMRDLVIWATALRLARSDEGGLLISADVVHSGELGSSEAAGANLQRVNTIDDALNLLSGSTPAARLLISLLEPAWTALLAEGVPLAATAMIHSVEGPTFVQGREGPSAASANVQLFGKEGLVRGKLAVHSHSGRRKVSLTNVRVGKLTLPDAHVAIDIPDHSSANTTAGQALRDLRELLER